MSEIKLTAIYEKAEEGGYIGYVVELPGANTQGETLEETRETLKEAATVLLDVTATRPKTVFAQNETL